MSALHPLAVPISAKLDNDGHIVEADSIFMELHLENGGGQGGVLAVPALLDACMRARQLKMRMGRHIVAATTQSRIDMWAEIVPSADYLDVTIQSWQETAKKEEYIDLHLDNEKEKQILEVTAAGQVKLDADFKILSLLFHGSGPEISPNDYMLRPWYDIFDFPDIELGGPDTALDIGKASHDWRRYDGQIVRYGDFPISWVAHVHPASAISSEISGFDVFLQENLEPADYVVADQVIPPEEIRNLFSGKLGASLKMPIGRIIANAETIGGRMQGPLRSDYANYAQDIAQAGRHLLELVEDLSDLEVVEDQNFSAAKDEIDLADLARRAAGLLAVKASDHNIRLDVPAAGESLPAIGEFRRVLQILLNLITNAIRYSPDGSMIWVRLANTDGQASLIVADQGNGIALEDQSRVFEKFERLGRSGDGGSGLGLYISRKLARAMGGDLKIESAPGKGARFILQLPGNAAES